LKPRYINVLGKRIKITYTKDLEKNHGALGLFDPIKWQIDIDYRVSLDKNALQLVLLHELVHALFERVGVTSTDLNENVEEILAECVANFVFETFKLKLRNE